MVWKLMILLLVEILLEGRNSTGVRQWTAVRVETATFLMQAAD